MNKKDKEILKLFIIECSVLRLSEAESLQRLADKGFKISRAYYYKLQKQRKESRFDRLHLIANTGLIDSHLDIIDTLNQIQAEMWAQYNKEKDPFKKVLIMEKLAELQYSISSYMDASQYIYERSVALQQQQQRKKKKLEQEAAAVS